MDGLIIDFESAARERNMQVTGSAHTRFSKIVHRVGPTWAGPTPHYIKDGGQGLTSLLEKESLQTFFRNMTRKPSIDFGMVASDVGMQRANSANTRFWKIMHRIKPKFRYDYYSITKQGTGNTSSMASDPRMSTSSTTPDGRQGNGDLEGLGQAQPAETLQRAPVEDREDHTYDNSSDDGDSLYSESEYLARFQQDVNTAATKVKLEENDMDLDFWDENS